MVNKPTITVTIIASQKPAGAELQLTFLASKRKAPTVAGAERINEKRAEFSLFMPRDRPAVMVMPERETPGTRAKHCDKPTISDCL